MSDDLLIDDQDRYARLRLITWWDQQRLASARVMVVGAGALGNEVLKNLALLGAGTIYVVDMDAVEHSNLARSVLFRAADCGRPKAEVAAEVVRELNPDVSTLAVCGDITTDVGLGLFHDVDLVIACLDNREARLWVNRCCWKVNTPWIDGGIQEINGVVKVFVPPHGACYECAMTDNDYRLINLRYSCPQLRREDLLGGKVPTAPTIASIIGGLQVQEAMKLLHKMPVQEGVVHVFNGVANQFYTTRIERREDCLSHETCPAAVAVDLSAAEHTVDQLLGAAARQLQVTGKLSLLLDRDLVVSVECSQCQLQQRVMQVRFAAGSRHAQCPACGQFLRPRTEHAVSLPSDLAGEKLRSLGVAPYDIVCVANGEQQYALLLDADKSRFQVGSDGR